MQILIFIIIGIIGGIIGGMGMGGGTLLIPLLTLFADIPQHIAQSINLIAFIPMSVAALIVHAKNKLLDCKYLLWVALPAVAASVPAALLVKKVGGRQLSRYFGIFLVVLGLYQLVSLIISKVNSYKKKKNQLKSLYKSVYK